MRSGPFGMRHFKRRRAASGNARAAHRALRRWWMISSGFSNSRKGRSGGSLLPPGPVSRRRPRSRDPGPVWRRFGLREYACPGDKRSTRASPWRTDSRSARILDFAFGILVAVETGDSPLRSVRSASLPAGSCQSRNRDRADRPGYPVFPRSNRITRSASREAPPNLRSRRRTWPSTRKKEASSWRRPSPRFSSTYPGPAPGQQ